MASTASSVSTTVAKRSSLLSFLKAAAFFGGFVIGGTKMTGIWNEREARLRAALAERDDRIRELLKDKMALENPPPAAEGPVSSGDPVQDWIDSLEK
mmetsp:Transcript_4613/g.12477  ORF Transcript_4613/g.12477 Transcript_4613/m.12477 type:complete len:97 (+) Transcript_4613:41-331(+)